MSVCFQATFSYVILYFGFKCYILIQNSFNIPALSTKQSKMARTMQRELFQALVVQTLIPFVMLYIPVLIVLICTVLLIKIGNASGTLCITVALYPVIDALPTLLIVKHYRKTVKGMLHIVHNGK